MIGRGLATCAIWCASQLFPALASDTGGALEKGWKLAEGNLFNESHAVFKDLKGQADVDERERQFGEAMTLLNVQPRTPENIGRAEKILDSLATNSDYTGLLAAFFLARIWEDYLSPPQPDRAQAAYRKLLERKTGNAVVEGAAVRLVLLAGAKHGDPETRHQNLIESMTLVQYLLTRAGRRDFHLSLGFALLRENDPKHALDQLLLADGEGITRPLVQRQVWIAIAETARQAGDLNLAKQYYQKFLGRYQRDNRAYTLSQHLEEIQRLQRKIP